VNCVTIDSLGNAAGRKRKNAVIENLRSCTHIIIKMVKNRLIFFGADEPRKII
jgi:hypothetical protein